MYRIGLTLDEGCPAAERRYEDGCGSRVKVDIPEVSGRRNPRGLRFRESKFSWPADGVSGFHPE